MREGDSNKFFQCNPYKAIFYFGDMLVFSVISLIQCRDSYTVTEKSC